MKRIERNLYGIIAVLFAVVFLPVAFCVFVIGSRMQYTEYLKPSLLFPEIVVFLIALPLAALCVFLIRLGGKKEITVKQDIILSIILVAATVPLYFLSLYIAREIAFHIGWDVMVVDGAALQIAEHKPMGYQSYFSIYTNNIPIAYLLGKILQLQKEMNSEVNPEIIWLEGNCIIMSLSVLFSALTVKKLTKNLPATVLSYLAGVLLIGFSAWKIAPYTDTYAQIFPILTIYFYVLYRKIENKILKGVLLAASVFCCIAGGFIKPNLLLLLIALVMTEGFTLFSDFKKRIVYFGILLACAGIFLVAFKSFEKSIPDRIGMEMNYNVEAGMSEYFYMGLNEENTGSYNASDVALYGEFQDTPRAERDRIIRGRAFDRIKEKGVFGLPYFWLRKMTMTFNDGTFGWFSEVWIESHLQPIVSDNSHMMDKLRAIYWPSVKNRKYATCCQILWFAMIPGFFGIPAALLVNWVKDRKRKAEGEEKEAKFCFPEGILLISFMGIFFYQMLFEARARYLFVFLPVLIVMSICGFGKVSAMIPGKNSEKTDDVEIQSVVNEADIK